MKKIDLIIVDEAGLHARPASNIVKEAGKYASKIELEYNGKTINLKSMLMILSLAIPQHSKITITIEGTDESVAIEQIEKLFIEHKLV
jgi:phosphocarrier protein HPr